MELLKTNFSDRKKRLQQLHMIWYFAAGSSIVHTYDSRDDANSISQSTNNINKECLFLKKEGKKLK
jgi:hypothetical protein